MERSTPTRQHSYDGRVDPAAGDQERRLREVAEPQGFDVDAFLAEMAHPWLCHARLFDQINVALERIGREESGYDQGEAHRDARDAANWWRREGFVGQGGIQGHRHTLPRLAVRRFRQGHRRTSEKGKRDESKKKRRRGTIWLTICRSAEMNPVDARRTLVVKFLQTTGPVTLAEVCDRFGWSESVSEDILNDLVHEGTVATGEFLPEKPSPQFCWQVKMEKEC